MSKFYWNQPPAIWVIKKELLWWVYLFGYMSDTSKVTLTKENEVKAWCIFWCESSPHSFLFPEFILIISHKLWGTSYYCGFIFRMPSLALSNHLDVKMTHGNSFIKIIKVHFFCAIKQFLQLCSPKITFKRLQYK